MATAKRDFRTLAMEGREERIVLLCAEEEEGAASHAAPHWHTHVQCSGHTLSTLHGHHGSVDDSSTCERLLFFMDSTVGLIQLRRDSQQS